MPSVGALGPLFPGGTGSTGLRQLGYFLFVVGAVVGISGAWSLKPNRTIFPRPKEESYLVQAGVYQYVRHPLYVSLIALGLGWALFWTSWPTVLATAGMAVFLDRKAAYEEKWLEEKFPEYPEYRRRVNRFLPGIY
jgi:protein-S-isoprenylcysteine O-methyltransferase Ste14